MGFFYSESVQCRFNFCFSFFYRVHELPVEFSAGREYSAWLRLVAADGPFLVGCLCVRGRGHPLPLTACRRCRRGPERGHRVTGDDADDVGNEQWRRRWDLEWWSGGWS